MKRSKLVTLIILGISLFVLSFFIREFNAVKTLELKSVNWRFEYRGKMAVDSVPIVIVAIDDQSFQSIPSRWPWPREFYARAIKNILDAGAKVVALDMVIDQPDPHGAASDSVLYEVLKKYHDRVVLTGKIELSYHRGGQLYAVKPIDLLTQTGTPWGIVGVHPDPDGFYRTYLFEQQAVNPEYIYAASADSVGEFIAYPSFAAQILRVFFRQENAPIQVNRKSIHFLGRDIPSVVPGRALFQINFFGPAGTFQTYSLDNVIDDSTFALKDEFDLDYYHTLKQDGVLKDKIVLIGSTIAELHDNFSTPFLEFTDDDGLTKKAEMPGVEIHANALATILTNNFISHVDESYILVFNFLMIFLIIVLSTRFRISLSVFFVLLISFLMLFFSYYVFAKMNLMVELVSPLVTVFLTYFSTNIYLYLETKREKQVILGAFTHYVPEKVVNQIIEDPSKLSLGGEEREISILFSDIASFTTISENISPRNLVTLINDYLTAMTDIVLEHDGIIDKYEGDAIMAEFGAPVYFEDHAIKAAEAALAMQDKLDQLRPLWKKKGYPPIHVRIGINTGEVILGNMGSRDVFDYTAMGDNVNLAARLESANKMYGTKIMVSAATIKKLKNKFWVRPLDLLRVKGKTKPVKVYELLAARGGERDAVCTNLCHVFTKGFQYYLDRNWEKALECFNYTVKLNPNDNPSAVYLRRVNRFRQEPPPEDWDGVFILDEK